MKTWIKTVACILIAWLAVVGSLAQATVCSEMPPPTIRSQTQVLVGSDMQESLHNSQMCIAASVTGYHRSACISLSCGMVALPSTTQTATIVVSVIHGLPSSLFMDQFIPEIMSPPPRMRLAFA